MSTTLELTFTLVPESLEGGYTRYVSSDLPGFRILCEPNESPFPLIERAAAKFIPAAIAAAMDKKLKLTGLRISSPATAMFRGKPATITMAAELARVQ